MKNLIIILNIDKAKTWVKPIHENTTTNLNLVIH